MKLQGKASYLIPFGQEHLNDDNYLQWLRDYDVMKTINRPEYLEPVGFEEVKKYCESVLSSRTDIFWALYDTSDDTFIGTTRVSKIDSFANTADVGILIGDRTKWGKGIATDAIWTMCKYLFEERDVRKISAGAMAVNTAMIKVFEKLGFQKEGVFRKQDKFEGDYHDHIYFGCFMDEFNFNIGTSE